MKQFIATGLISCLALVALPETLVADGFWCDSCYSPPVYYRAPVYYVPPVYYAPPIYYSPHVTYYTPAPLYGAYRGSTDSTPFYYPHRTVVRSRSREVYRGW